MFNRQLEMLDWRSGEVKVREIDMRTIGKKMISESIRADDGCQVKEYRGKKQEDSQ